MLVDPCNLKDIKIDKGKNMKQRKFLNILFEVIVGIVVLGLLFWGFKVWDPINKYNLDWLKTSIISQDVKEQDVISQDVISQEEKIDRQEARIEDQKEEIMSTSRFKVEYESKSSTGGPAGIYVVTDKATNQKYIGLSGIALTPLK
jgi:hypothetical protein